MKSSHFYHSSLERPHQWEMTKRRRSWPIFDRLAKWVGTRVTKGLIHHSACRVFLTRSRLNSYSLFKKFKKKSKIHLRETEISTKSHKGPFIILPFQLVSQERLPHHSSLISPDFLRYLGGLMICIHCPRATVPGSIYCIFSFPYFPFMLSFFFIYLFINYCMKAGSSSF